MTAHQDLDEQELEVVVLHTFLTVRNAFQALPPRASSVPAKPTWQRERGWPAAAAPRLTFQQASHDMKEPVPSESTATGADGADAASEEADSAVSRPGEDLALWYGAWGRKPSQGFPPLDLPVDIGCGSRGSRKRVRTRAQEGNRPSEQESLQRSPCGQRPTGCDSWPCFPTGEKAALVLRGLPFCATEADVLALIKQAGAAEALAQDKPVRLLMNPSGRASGFAEVHLSSQADSCKVAEKLHMQRLGSRYLEVLPYRDSPSSKLRCAAKRGQRGTE